VDSKHYDLERYISIRPPKKLWDFQESAVQFIIDRETDGRGTLLCDEMGLGKTMTSLCTILRQNQAASRQSRRRFNGATLIICEEMLIDNWLKEMSEFPEESFAYFVLTNTQHRDLTDAFYYENCCDIVLTTYTTLVSVVSHGKWKDIFYGIVWRRIIADEVHKIVNMTTHVAQALYQLKAVSKLGLTGTPQQNHQNDINSLLKFIDADDSEPLSSVMLMRQKNDVIVNMSTSIFQSVTKCVKLIQFRSKVERVLYYMYAKYALQLSQSPGKHNGDIPQIIGTMRQLCITPILLKNLTLPRGMLLIGGDAASGVNDTLSQFMTLYKESIQFDYHTGNSYKKVDHVDYIDSERDMIPCQWTKRLELSQIDSDHYNLIFNEFKTTPGHWATTEKMLQSHDSIEKTESFITDIIDRTLRLDMLSSKEDSIIQYIKEAPSDDQIIVYSTYIDVLNRLCEVLDKLNISAVVVTGGITQTNNKKSLELFGCGEKKVLLMTLKKGSEGLNMHNANHVLFIDPWWNPFVMKQAESRVHRPGQLKKVYVVYFIMDQTIELCIFNYMLRKQNTLNLFDKNQMTTEEKSCIFDYTLNIIPSPPS
jgi:SNF2 family DNA or RNA helicase